MNTWAYSFRHLKGHSQLCDCADLDTSFSRFKKGLPQPDLKVHLSRNPLHFIFAVFCLIFHTIAIKTQVFMFRYELINSTKKFTIVAEIVSLLKKIYKRDAPFRAVSFSPYPREMKHTAKFKSAAILALASFYGNGAIHSHARSIARAWLMHAHSFDRCGARGRDSWC